MGSLFRRKRKRTNGTVILLPTLWLKYHQHGRQVRESSGTTNPVKARRMLRDREGDVEKGVPVNPQMGRLTFDEAAKALVADYTVNNRSTLADVVRRVDVHLAPSFRMHRLGEIRTTHVQAFTAARLLAGASRAEVNRELAALKRMFTLAIRAGQVVAKPHIPMLREDNTRRGFFEANEFERLREALPLPLQPVVTFAYLTGWRLTSEVLPLTWSQVDFKASVVRLDPGTTKNREGRSFPFTQELHALLKAQFAARYTDPTTGQPGAHVFHREGKAIKSIREAWASACDVAGVTGRIPHDFRRTAVRNLELAGVPRAAAMAMVGHKTESIYRRYAIVDAGTLRAAARKIDEAR